jgi:hypothetical protein
MRKLAIVIATLAALTEPAWPCLNGTIYEGDAAVRAIVQVEADLAAGRPGAALSTISGGHFLDDRVQARVNDAQYLASLRLNPGGRTARNAMTYFGDRARREPKNVKLAAWYAESLAAAGKTADAKQILVGLKERDLMPDAFAYLTLAKISDGADRTSALETCTKRAKVKAICAMPQRAAPKKKPTYEMRLPS